MNSSRLVFNSTTGGDAIRVRATLFTGRPQAVLDLAADLVEAGHRVTSDPVIPGLFRIDDGPELTVNQFLAVGHGLLPA